MPFACLHLPNRRLNELNEDTGWGLPQIPQKGGRLAGSHAEYKRFLTALDIVQCSIGMTY